MTTWILITVACCLTAFAWLMGLLAPRWCSARAWLALYSGHGLMFVLLVFAAARAELSHRTEEKATEPIRAEVKATEPNDTDRIGWNPTAEERYAEVVAAIGPPPTPDAVPVLGYETKGGAKYPPRWRTRPDAERDNNFKR